MSDKEWVRCCCCFTLFTVVLSLILQTVGFFTPYWVIWEGCEAQGLFYYLSSNSTNECVGEGEYISLVSTILEATSFAFLLVCLMFCPVICPEPQVQGMEWVCTPCILYLAAGICSIAGCIMMGFVNVQNFSYGWSYRLCFASGIYVVIQVVLPLIVFGDKSSSSCDRS